ncbi:hypothetical protein [Agromyces bracchium]|uniref:Uncharacterized protein n=1 Tax=Agromyces bracchium TaxID=88376 RepID=A0A6I3M662_9MICO|nr:hypothetical protein [Agromyces bracchium]MTH66826.1 hypothetical protein [Agromyces bracchium]
MRRTSSSFDGPARQWNTDLASAVTSIGTVTGTRSVEIGACHTARSVTLALRPSLESARTSSSPRSECPQVAEVVGRGVGDGCRVEAEHERVALDSDLLQLPRFGGGEGGAVGESGQPRSFGAGSSRGLCEARRYCTQALLREANVHTDRT